MVRLEVRLPDQRGTQDVGTETLALLIVVHSLIALEIVVRTARSIFTVDVHSFRYRVAATMMSSATTTMFVRKTRARLRLIHALACRFRIVARRTRIAPV